MKEIGSKGTSSRDQNPGRSLDVARSRSARPESRQGRRSSSRDSHLAEFYGADFDLESESDTSSDAPGSRQGSQSGDASSGRSSSEASHSSEESDASSGSRRGSQSGGDSSGRSSPEVSDASGESDALSDSQKKERRTTCVDYEACKLGSLYLKVKNYINEADLERRARKAYADHYAEFGIDSNYEKGVKAEARERCSTQLAKARDTKEFLDVLKDFVAYKRESRTLKREYADEADLKKQADEAFAHLKEEGYKTYTLHRDLLRHMTWLQARSKGIDVTEGDLKVLADAKEFDEDDDLEEPDPEKYTGKEDLWNKEREVLDRLKAQGKDLDFIHHYLQKDSTLLKDGASQSTLLEGLDQSSSGKRRQDDTAASQRSDEEGQSRSKRSRLGESSTGLTAAFGEVSVTTGKTRGLEKPWTSYQTDIEKRDQQIDQRLGEISLGGVGTPREKLEALTQLSRSIHEYEKAHRSFAAKEGIYSSYFQDSLDLLRGQLASTKHTIGDLRRRERDLQREQGLLQAQGRSPHSVDQSIDGMEVDDVPQARTPDHNRFSSANEGRLQTISADLGTLSGDLKNLQTQRDELQAKLEKQEAEEEHYSDFRVKGPVRELDIQARFDESVRQIFRSESDLAREYAFKTNDSRIIPLARQSTLDRLDSGWSNLKTPLESYFQKRDCYSSIGQLTFEVLDPMPLSTTGPLLTDVSRALSPFRSISETMPAALQEAASDLEKVPSLLQQLDTSQVRSQFAQIMPKVDQECRRHFETLHRYCLDSHTDAPEELRQHAQQTVDSFQQELRTPEDFRKRFEGVHKFLEQVASWEKDNTIQVMPLVPPDQTTLSKEQGDVIEVTKALRAKYDTSQADKPGARGRKLTYTNPVTKKKTAFFIPRNKKGIFERRKEILAVINEKGVIAKEKQLYAMLQTKVSAKYWNVEKCGEEIAVTDEMRAKYDTSRRESLGQKEEAHLHQS